MPPAGVHIVTMSDVQVPARSPTACFDCCWSWCASASGTLAHRLTAYDLAPASEYWVDFTGSADIQAVSRLRPEELLPLDSTRRFQLGDQGALWVRLTLPERDPAERWFIVLDGSTVIEQATAYQPDGTGAWRTQQAGDRIPVNDVDDSRPNAIVRGRIGPRSNTSPGCGWRAIPRH